MPLPDDHPTRWQRLLLALDGLSIGDAFGQRFFASEMHEWCRRNRMLPPPIWKYTDDTEMALAIRDVIAVHGEIDPDALAAAFAERYHERPWRSYGAFAQDILGALVRGADWRIAAASVFEGSGSYGNGSAMRVAPLGAYFAGDMQQVVGQAERSAAITHAHPEGSAGAIAVAIAAAWCCERVSAAESLPGESLLQAVIENTPESKVRRGVEQALKIPLDEWEFTAAEKLGNGSQITTMDTVPFCLWSAAARLNDYAEALWTTMRVGGDIDTNCAIVGGIVACAVGCAGIPEEYLLSREPLG